MFNIAELRDLKLQRIVSRIEPFALDQARTLRYELPSDVIVFISNIILDSDTAVMTLAVTSLLIDDVNLLAQGQAGNASRQFYTDGDRIFSTVAPLRPIDPPIPCRRSIVINITSGAIAGDASVAIFGYVHRDDDKEFQSASTITTIS